MSSIIKLEAISGVHDDGPLCYLLQVDQVYILLDCGWDERFEMGYIEAVRRRIPQISAVLISYADIAHIGALPYLVGKCGLRCPIYATVPVYKMGQLFLQDWLSGHRDVEDFTLFNADDIDAAFDNIQHVKYSQIINLKGDSGLQVMPLPAGHMIGGAIWRITKMGEEEIVYAVDFNHRKERHLNACTFNGVGQPNLLITNPLGDSQKRKTRDETLVAKLITTLREGGDAMIVIDSAGRVLELAHLLDQLWQSKESGLMAYNLVMLSHVANAVIEAAKSQVEWMSDKVLRLCELGRANPFQFRFLKCCHSLAELNAIRSPKVVLVSSIDMESGHSRELFLEWCSDPKNIIIVTGRSIERSLGSKLIDIAEKRVASNVVTLAVKRRIRLEGVELEAYRARKKEQEDAEARLRLENARRNIRMDKDDESSEDSDEEYLMPPAARKYMGTLNTGVTSELGYGYDLIAKFEQTQRLSFFKRNKKHFPMFPHIEEKFKSDEYGQIIRPEDYMLAEPTRENRRPRDGNAVANADAVKKEETDEAEALRQAQLDEWPTKCVSYVEKIEVACKVEYIDFEGRADAESILKIISQLRPKQLALVHGSASTTNELATKCKEKEYQENVFTPRLGEVVDVTVESHIFQVTLTDPLMSSLIFQTVRDAELGWVDARIRKRRARSAVETEALAALTSGGGDDADAPMDDVEVLDAETVAAATHAAEAAAAANSANVELPHDAATTSAVAADETMDVDGEAVASSSTGAATAETVRLNATAQAPDEVYLDLLPAVNVPPHEAVFVNDPKLTDMKVFLLKLGFAPEFSAGVLYVNDTLAITRNEAGKFAIEGPACEEYYRIQDAVYSQFAIV